MRRADKLSHRKDFRVADETFMQKAKERKKEKEDRKALSDEALETAVENKTIII